MMTINAALRLIAGAFVLISVLLGVYVHEYWFLLTAFVALNLMQSAFSGWCPMMTILAKAGLKSESSHAEVNS